eukprot:2925362-Rhodomonas_salina.2
MPMDIRSCLPAGTWQTRAESESHRDEVPRSRNRTQETAVSVQFVPGMLFLVVKFGVWRAGLVSGSAWLNVRYVSATLARTRTWYYVSTGRRIAQYRTSRSSTLAPCSVPQSRLDLTRAVPPYPSSVLLSA